MSIDRRFYIDPNPFKRVSYHNGLFLEEADFKLDQNYFATLRRYLNYLLFEEGRLYLEESDRSLELDVAGMTLTIRPGVAMIHDRGPSSLSPLR